jgi:hypothetical protein
VHAFFENPCLVLQEGKPGPVRRIVSEAEWRRLQSKLDGGGATADQLVQTDVKGSPPSRSCLEVGRKVIRSPGLSSKMKPSASPPLKQKEKFPHRVLHYILFRHVFLLNSENNIFSSADTPMSASQPSFFFHLTLTFLYLSSFFLFLSHFPRFSVFSFFFQNEICRNPLPREVYLTVFPIVIFLTSANPNYSQITLFIKHFSL